MTSSIKLPNEAALELEKQKLGKRKTDAFVTEYNGQRGLYGALARRTRDRCEELLHDISIKGLVSYRVKGACSLKKKLDGMIDEDTEFLSWVVSGKPIQKHNEMGDLVGVRIGLYLPADIATVDEIIRENFNVVHIFGTVPGGRRVTTERNLDVQQHNRGPWMAEGPYGLIHWQHYGYKSWQMVAEWKEESSDSLRRFEIQIGTAVSQAWAEVQHNIIYKQPEGFKSTLTMRRMIDAVNGLAITTEILLHELDQTVRKEQEEMERAMEEMEAINNWFAVD